MTNLDAAFDRAMMTIYEQAKAIGYNAARFRQLVGELGGRAAAKRLLASAGHPEGLTRLWQEGRLDISMEALVLQPAWRDLFTDEERAIAANRLRALGYQVAL